MIAICSRLYFRQAQFSQKPLLTAVFGRDAKQNKMENKMENKKKHPVIEKFLKWKDEHPNEDYQYDEINEFFSDLSRGDMLDFMEWVVSQNGS